MQHFSLFLPLSFYIAVQFEMILKTQNHLIVMVCACVSDGGCVCMRVSVCNDARA